MRNVTVFLIWQSDNKTARNRLSRALERVAADLSAEDLTLAIDQDTRAETGSVTIDHVILDRIAIADVVVADVTPVGRTAPTAEASTAAKQPGSGEIEPAGKVLPNPNVMFEVGFAFTVVGPERVILVRDTDGLSGDMPFDIRNRETLHFAKPAQLRDELKDRITKILERGPDLPGSSTDRATIVRMLAEPQPTLRTGLAAELDLLAETPDDVWSRLAEHFRTKSAASVGSWRPSWHYGDKPDLALQRDLRRALLPATRTDARAEAIERMERFLDGVGVLAERQLLLQIDKQSWLVSPNYASGGSFTTPANLAKGVKWLDDVEKLGFDVRAARKAHSELSGASGGWLKAFAQEVRSLESQLRETDPTNQPVKTS